jgi:hypothetical protein
MPRQTPISQPKLVRQSGNLNTQKPPISNSTNKILAGDLVYITGGALARVPTDGVLAYGFSPGAAVATTATPPESLPMGVGSAGQLYPFDLSDQAEIEINIGSLSANAVASAVASDVTIGTAYGVCIPTSGTLGRTLTNQGTTLGTQILDVTDTTNTLLVVTGFVETQDPDTPVLSDDLNPRVRCKIIASKLQA